MAHSRDVLAKRTVACVALLLAAVFWEDVSESRASLRASLGLRRAGGQAQAAHHRHL